MRQTRKTKVRHNLVSCGLAIFFGPGGMALGGRTFVFLDTTIPDTTNRHHAWLQGKLEGWGAPIRPPAAILTAMSKELVQLTRSLSDDPADLLSAELEEIVDANLDDAPKIFRRAVCSRCTCAPPIVDTTTPRSISNMVKTENYLAGDPRRSASAVPSRLRRYRFEC